MLCSQATVGVVNRFGRVELSREDEKDELNVHAISRQLFPRAEEAQDVPSPPIFIDCPGQLRVNRSVVDT